VQRIAFVLVAVMSVASVTFGIASAEGTKASGPLLGITGDVARFNDQTGQVSNVRQAFLGWDQGHSYGSSFSILFRNLAPIPMIHLGTKGRGKTEAITPGGIASGQGDGYLIALNEAIAVWGKGIYVRPMAEMNNASALWSGYLANGRPRDAAHSPPSYRNAFARIYVILHGGSASAVNAKLTQLGLPPLNGGDLPVNPFPRLRIVWSPLASDNPRVPGNAAERYYPGAAFVDVEGGDIYDERLTDTAPWQGLEHLYSVARSRHEPFAVPEWGLFQLDDPAFVQHMCTFLKTHAATELAAFYESRPASIFDLESKPKSRSAYRVCIRPIGETLPDWAVVTAPKLISLTLTPGPASGPVPLNVQFLGRRTAQRPDRALARHLRRRSPDRGHRGAADDSPAHVCARRHLPRGAGRLPVSSVHARRRPLPDLGRRDRWDRSFEADLVRADTDGRNRPAQGLVPDRSQRAGRRRKLADRARRRQHAAGQWASAPLHRAHLYERGDISRAADRERAGGWPLPRAGERRRRRPAGGQGKRETDRKGAAERSAVHRRDDPLRLEARCHPRHPAAHTDTGTVLVYGNGVFAAFVLLRGTDNGKPIVELRLTGGNFAACARKLSVASKAKPKVIRQLWAKAKGRFRTRGRYASATVRGTGWLTADRCDGTLVKVNQGIVQVSDFTLKKKLLVRAGTSHLAKKP